MLRTNLSHAQVLPDPDTPLPAQDQPPVIASTPDVFFTFQTSDTYELSDHVSDDGLSSLTYSMSGSLPLGVTLDPDTGTISYDGGGATASTSHTFTVEDAVGNDVSDLFGLVIAAPTIATIPPISVNQGQSTSLSSYVSDPFNLVTSSQLLENGSPLVSTSITYSHNAGNYTITGVSGDTTVTGLSLEVTY